MKARGPHHHSDELSSFAPSWAAEMKFLEALAAAKHYSYKSTLLLFPPSVSARGQTGYGHPSEPNWHAVAGMFHALAGKGYPWNWSSRRAR